MVLIGIDTSGKQGSLALARIPQKTASVEDIEMVETVPLEGGTFSAQLIPQLAELLARNGFSKQGIGAFAVASGPGSFTGLRVGLAAVKGLAEVLKKPIVAASLLEATARVSSEGHGLAALDAGRNELFVGEYEAGVLVGDERLIARVEFLESAHVKVVTSDPRLVEDLMGRGKKAELVEHPGSAGIARLGWQKLRAGLLLRPEELEANYIRRSDAEIVSKA
jgi:tRNA threonylcarbamoyladenosine biosynthesis protein TsaB